MAFVAGVDSSTQSCKVVIVDSDTGTVVRSGTAPHPGGTEVDPEVWWHALGDAIEAAGGIADVEAISVAAQQHGLVALDERGDVIRPALLWNDTRSGEAARQLREEVGSIEYAERTGVVPVASFTASKLRWLRDHEPENAARVAAVALPHDWLTWRLLGNEPGGGVAGLVTDRSDASGTAYWGSVDGYQSDLFVRALGHDAVRPRVLDPGEPAGSLRSGAVVGAGAGDNAAAALGLGIGAGDAVISLGTSGTVFTVMAQGVSDPTGTVACFADATGGFLPLVATLNAARVLDLFSELLGVSHSSLGDLALAAPPGGDGIVLIPWFNGERTPNLPNAVAAMEGMTEQNTTRSHIARAAIEGMLCGLAAGLDRICDLGPTMSRVLLIGGAARTPAVSAIAAQVYGLPVATPSPAEYVAIGAARQAAWALTGTLPEWQAPLDATIPPDLRPMIRTNYERVASRRVTLQ